MRQWISKSRESTEWAPHFKSKFSDDQLALFAAEPYESIDSRCTLEVLNKVGLEVVLTGNPAEVKEGVKILCTNEGFFEECSEPVDDGISLQWPNGPRHYKRVDFKILTIRVPLIDRFCYTFRYDKFSNHGARMRLF